jgi:hypothetical protein
MLRNYYTSTAACQGNGDSVIGGIGLASLLVKTLIFVAAGCFIRRESCFYDVVF